MVARETADAEARARHRCLWPAPRPRLRAASRCLMPGSASSWRRGSCRRYVLGAAGSVTTQHLAKGSGVSSSATAPLDLTPASRRRIACTTRRSKKEDRRLGAEERASLPNPGLAGHRMAHQGVSTLERGATREKVTRQIGVVLPEAHLHETCPHEACSDTLFQSSVRRSPMRGELRSRIAEIWAILSSGAHTAGARRRSMGRRPSTFCVRSA